ncbi:MAG: isoprenyl transferase [Bacteroidia bacterium]
MSLKDKINLDKIPQHIAVIMDGNGRWANQRGKERSFGHENGVTAVRETVEAAAQLGIKFITLYAFSTENWNRPRHEIDLLMQLLVSTINSERKTLSDNDIKLDVIGDFDALPENCHNELKEAMAFTSNNKRMTMVVALSYSSRWELTNATRKIAEDVKSKKINPDDINESLLQSYLCTASMPDPELLIRTSGEYRISNFLLWQIAYAELYFTPKQWPDFRKEDLYEAILSYQQRERRFGMTSDQIITK